MTVTDCADRLARLEERVTSIRDYVDARFTALALALDKAENATDHRLSLLNEFRAQAAEQARDYVNAASFNALKERVDKASGEQAGTRAAIAGVLAALSVVVSIALAFIR